MTYCSRQGSSQLPISTFLSVMHFSPCRRLRTAPATINHDPAFPESNLMLCNGHNVSAKSARTVPHGLCPCTRLQERLAACCPSLEAQLSIRFRQRAVNQWSELLFQTPGSKLHPKSFWSKEAGSSATPDYYFQSQYLPYARVYTAACS